MPQARPMLGDVELQQVQQLDVEKDHVLAQHAVPALEGDFLQRLGRRATRVTVAGVLTGPDVADGLTALREKFRAAEPVSFVADIATATRVDQVLIEEMGVRELAGWPQRFEYSFTLREYTPAPETQREQPPPPPPPPPPPVDTGTLVVAVTVEGQPDFDMGRVTVTVEGTQDDGTSLSRTLTNRENNVWTEEGFPPGQYTATATVSDPPPMSGSATATVQAGQTTRVQITLHPGSVSNIAKAFIVHFRFDKAFVEPCMRGVLRRVMDYAQAHPAEKMLVVGHTDKTGSDTYNQSLSERRARAVYAYLISGRDGAAARAEWGEIRKRASGGLPSLNDSWGVYQYQSILQDLGYYRGNLTETETPDTNAAVRAFQQDKGLGVDGIVGDQTWTALIDAYLAQDQDVMTLDESRLLPNAKDGCDGGRLKWLGCGEEDPVRNTEDAWRPNRRVEILFVQAERLPCDVPKPVTFDKPTPGAVNSAWCLGPDSGRRACFLARGTAQPGKWLVQPAETEQITVRGSIHFEDGTPAANMPYVIIAPDGEFMDGEVPSGAGRGEGIAARTRADGTFEYPGRQKPVGIYTLEVIAPVAIRNADEPPEAAKGNVVCKRLEVEGEQAVKAGGAAEAAFPTKVGKAAPSGPKAHPHINLASPIVIVPKSYTSPARQAVTLRADVGFVGTGKFERSSPAIKFFTLAAGGVEITFNGVDNVFPDNQLTAPGGVQLFAQGETASTKAEDVELTLALNPGGGGSVGPSLPAGPPTKVTMTAVELTLDICTTRTTPGSPPPPFPQPPTPPPAPGTATDKWFAGRPIHVQVGARGKRALLIVRQKPATFKATLVLRQVVVAGNIITGVDTKAKLFETETGGAAQANPHEFSASSVPAAGKQFFVEGATVSGGLRDTGFQLGIKGVDDDGDRIALTVFQVDKVDAKLRGTPCKRDGSRADPMPAKSSADDSRVFGASAITLVRECGDLKLTATVRPAAIPMTWDVERATDDKGLTGLLTHTADPAAPADNKKRVVKGDATGSFHVHAFVDVNGNGKRGADEDGIIFNVTMVNIEIQPGAANNRIITRDTLFRNNRSNAAVLVGDSGSTAGIVPGVNAAYTDAEFLKHPLAMKVTVKLTGGGANQRRGTDKIGLGYIQQTPADSVTGTYADGRTLKEVIVQNTATPEPITTGTPTMLGFPVRDTRGANVSGTGPFIISSSDADKSPIAAGGQQRIVRYVDPPAIAIRMTHPVTGSALASISGSNNFDVFLCAFSSDFDENFTVIATASWSITYGTFAPGPGWTNAGAHVTALAAMTALAKLTPGETTNVERCPPNFVDNLRMDAR